jgi:phosphoenolpyruvate synthase/pyruvate phosphate dikinase
LSLDQTSRKDVEVVGGKAANLGELASLRLPVPRGFVIPVSIRERLGEGRIGELEFERELTIGYERLGAPLVAVRSSATIEDSNALSFAGVFDSVLHVDQKSLRSAVERCWQSARSIRSAQYCRDHGLDPSTIKMAVVIQEMVSADYSGICFTCHPVTQRHDELYIEIAPGSGEAVVSGRITPNSYTYDVNKSTLIPVAEHKILGELRTETMHDLASSCVRIRDHFARPQDIEFCVKMDSVYFLQSRPITTLDQDQYL